MPVEGRPQHAGSERKTYKSVSPKPRGQEKQPNIAKNGANPTYKLRGGARMAKSTASRYVRSTPRIAYKSRDIGAVATESLDIHDFTPNLTKKEWESSDIRERLEKALKPKDLALAETAFGSQLRGGKQMTRDTINKVLDRVRFSTNTARKITKQIAFGYAQPRSTSSRRGITAERVEGMMPQLAEAIGEKDAAAVKKQLGHEVVPKDIPKEDKPAAKKKSWHAAEHYKAGKQFQKDMKRRSR